MKCPDCAGTGKTFAMVDGTKYRGPMELRCSRCSGTGQTDPQTERWRAIGGTHRTWRVAQHESARECAVRLGINLTELSDMEAGRADPGHLVEDTPAMLRVRAS